MHTHSYLLLAALLLPSHALFGQPAASSDVPLGFVAGKPIFEQDLFAVAGTQLHQIYDQEYDLKRRALDTVVAQRVVENEAAKRGIPLQDLLKEIDSQVPEPSEAELKAYYLGQRDQIKQSYEEVKLQLKQAWMQTSIQEARRAYVHKLSDAANVVVLLSPPKTEVPQNPQRLRGNPAAPVKIVEFADFQCPYCRQAEDVLRAVVAKYEGKVSLSFLDLPLRSIHPQAQGAAEAARCVGDQGKFWEYHDRLFQDQAKLDAKGLQDSAAAVGVNVAKYEECIASGKFRAAIEQDTQAAARAGVSATPAFFINGVFLNGSPDMATIQRVINEQLTAAAH